MCVWHVVTHGLLIGSSAAYLCRWGLLLAAQISRLAQLSDVLHRSRTVAQNGRRWTRPCPNTLSLGAQGLHNLPKALEAYGNRPVHTSVWILVHQQLCAS